MDSGKTIAVCFLVITPVLVIAAYKFFGWYMVQGNAKMHETGEERRSQGFPPVVTPVATVTESA
jgi:hypothetical protein